MIPAAFKRLVPTAVAASLLLSAGLVWASPAIVTDGKTQTTVVTAGNVTDITTATVRGINAFNSFSKFNVDAGTIANLYLPTGTSNLLNLVHNETSYINGMLNSIKNGVVGGGNVFFLNPHGVVFGAGGSVNVGSLAVITPPKAFMDGFFTSPGNPSDAATKAVLDGSVPVSESGFITVRGKINAKKDVKLAAGTVANSGEITTGAVFASSKVDFSDVVNINGYQSGARIAVENGAIEIVAAGNIENSGIIAADGASGVKAGNITLKAGGDIKLAEGSVVSARGRGENSAGGKIYIYGQNNAALTKGVLDASGGETSGDGGFVEFSAKNKVAIDGGTLVAGAANGKAGTVYIDPTDIVWTGSANDKFNSGGTNYALSADSITLTDVVISTRQVAAGDANRANIDTAASTGDSGNITLTAPVITLNSGTKLLAHAVNSGATTYAGGDIALTATKTVDSAFADATTKITIDGATLKGRNITASATSSASYAWTGSAADIATRAATDVLLSNTVLYGLTGLNVGVAVATGKAEVEVKGGAVIEATGTGATKGNVSLVADTTARAESLKLGVDAFTLNSLFNVGVVYGKTDATATVDIQSGTITGSTLTVAAKNDAHLEVNVIGFSNKTTTNVAIAVTNATVDAKARIASGVTVNMDKAVAVTAKNTSSFDTSATAMAFEQGKVGVAVAVHNATTSATATNDANLTTSGVKAVIVNALDDTIKNKTASSSAAGSGALAAKTIVPVLNMASSATSQFSQALGAKLDAGRQDLNPAAGGGKPKLASAIAFVDSSHTATATIGTGATAPNITVADDVVVAAKVSDALIQTHAASSVDGDGSTANPTAKYALSAGIAIGKYSHDSSATIGKGVAITAKNIGVRSDVLLPYRETWTKWDSVGAVLGHLNSNLGVANGFLTGFANATSDTQPDADGSGGLGLAGAVAYMDFTNTSKAVVDKSAHLTTLANTGTSWGITSASAAPSLYNIDLTAPVDISSRIDSRGVFAAGNISVSLQGAGGNGAKSVGGAYGQVNYTNTNKAYVAEGAIIEAKAGAAPVNVNVSAETSTQVLTITPTSGRGASIGVNAIFGLVNVNDNTKASVDDEAQVKASALTVRAQEDVNALAIAGAVNTASGAGVGASVALTNVTADTQSFVGDNDSDSGGSTLTLTTGKVTATAVNVNARTDGRVESIGVAGTVASSNGPIDPSSTSTLGKAFASVGSGLFGKGVSPAEQPKFGLAVSGTAAVNEVALTTKAYVAEANIELAASGATSLNVSAVNNTDITAAGGAAALTRAGSTATWSAAIAGSIALNNTANTTEAYVQRSTVTNAKTVDVSALAGGEQLAVALGMAVTAGEQAKSVGVAGSVSVSLANNTTSARVEGSTITGQTTAGGRTVNVAGYDRLKLGTGGGSLIVGGKGGIGAAVTYSDIDNTTEALVKDNTSPTSRSSVITNYDNVNIHAQSAAKIAAGAGMAALSTTASSLTLSGAIVISDIGNTVAAKTENSTVTAASGVDLLAADTTGIAAYNTIIDSRGTNPNPGMLSYNNGEIGLSAPAGSSIVSVAGLLQAGQNNVGVALTFNTIHNKFTAGIKDSAVSAGTSGALNVQAGSSASIDGLALGVGVAAGSFSGTGSSVTSDIANSTKAYIENSAAKTVTAGALTVKAEDKSAISSVAGAGSFSKGGAAGAAVAVNHIGNASADDPRVSAHLSGGDYNLGSLTVKGASQNTIRSIAVGVGGATNVGIAGSVAVNSISGDTSGYIDGGAKVTARDNAAVIARGDEAITNAAGSAGVGITGAGVGVSVAVNEIQGNTKAYISGTDTKVTAKATDSANKVTVAAGGLTGALDLDKALNISTYDQTDLKSMLATEAVTGVAVNAAATHSIENISANIAAGQYAGIAATVSVNSIGGKTQSYVDGAKINAIADGAGTSAQNVSIKAADHAYSNGFVGTVAAGAAGIGVGTDVGNFQRTTSAYVNNSGELRSAGSTAIAAQSSQGASSLVAGGAGGLGAVAGTGSVANFKSTTEAYLQASTAYSGDLKINAAHDSHFAVKAGGVTVGGLALTGTFAVVSDESTTTAALTSSTANASGAVEVGAGNTTEISNWGASGALGGGAGIAGSAVVSNVHSTTQATITGSTVGTSASKAASLSVHAKDTTTVENRAGALGLGVAGGGIGASASVVKVDNTVSALVDGSNAYLTGAATVDAQGERTIDNKAVTAGAGASLGIGGTAVVTNIGQKLTGDVTNELDKDNSGTLSKVNDLTTADHLSSGLTARGLTADQITTLNNNTRTDVKTKLNTDSLTGRTAAVVSGTSSVLNAGGNIQVSAGEKDRAVTLAGSLGAGGIGIGGAVAVQNITNNVEASALGTVQLTSTGGDIGITASTARLSSSDSASKVEAYQGSAGIVALGAAVAKADLTNNITARAARGTTLTASGTAKGITVQASDTTDVDAEAKGFSAGFAAAGAVVSVADKGGTVAATIGDTDAAGAGTTVTATGSVSVDASRSGQVKAYALAGVGGVIAGNGSDARATESGNVTARLGNKVTVAAPAAAVAVTAAAQPQVIAEQRGYGGSLLANVGIGFANATANPIVEASVGTGGSIAAKTVEVNAATRQNGTNATAASDAEAVGIGGLVGFNLNQSKAQSTSQVSAAIGAGTQLTVSGSTKLSASNVTYETATVSGKVGGAIAAGAFQADADANSTTTATLGSGVYGYAGATLTVLASGQDNTYASATSGSGGLVSGLSTEANTHNGSTTTATLGGGTAGGSALSAGSMLLTGRHEAIFNSKADSINASLLGMSGATANNYTYASGGSAATGTTVTAQIAPNANLLTCDIEGLAYNKTTKDWLAGGSYNANAGAGGLASGAAAGSTTDIDQYTHFVFGSGSRLNVTGDRYNPGKTSFSAVNEVVARDKTKLDTGGAITVAKAESQINALHIDADVTMGSNAAIDSVGPVKLGARTGADIQTSANAKTYGLAGAAQGQSTSAIGSNNTVTIGAGADIRADGDISLYAGRDAGGTANNLSAVANTDLYNKTAVPIKTKPEADADVTQKNEITVTAGAKLRSVFDVNLITDKGTFSASGQGIGKDLYREIIAEVGSVFGLNFSLDIHGGSSKTTATSAVTVDGQVNAGIQHTQFLDISRGNPTDYTTNPQQPDEIVETVTIQTGSQQDPAYPNDPTKTIPIYSTLTVRRTPGVTYSVGTENLQSNLVTRINALKQLKGQFGGKDGVGGDQNTATALQAEIDFLQSELSAMFPAGSDQSQVTASVNDVPLITVNNVIARSGNITLEADKLTGTGSLVAPGDATISIINRGEAFLRTDKLTIPEYAGGNVYYRGVSVSNAAGITARNPITKDESGQDKHIEFKGTVTAAATSPAPVITVENKYVPSGDDALAPNIELVGDISNLRGALNVKSAAGSVNIQSADPNNPLTAPSIAAGTINISAGKNFVFNSPNSWLNVGGDPRSIWGGLRDVNGNKVPGVDGSETADNYEDAYKAAVLARDFSSSASSVAAGRSGSGGITAGGNIFISARYVNVNGTIQSGHADFTLGVPNSSALATEVAAFQADYDAKVLAGKPPGDPTYQMTTTTGNVTAFYNAATRQIEMQQVRSQGGQIQMVGEILNTGGGQLKVMDGLSHINATNSSVYDLVVKGLDTGGDGIAGKVIITDFAQQYMGAPVTTTYTRKNGTIYVEQTATVYGADGKATTYVKTADASTGSARGDGNAVNYNPATGERFMWVTGSSASTYDKWDKTVVTGGWSFSWSSDNYYGGEHTQISGSTRPIPSNGYETFTPTAAQRTAWGSQTDAYKYTGKADQHYFNEWNERHDWSSGFLGYYKHHQNIHYEVTGEQITNVNSVKGDYAIPIKFIGYDTGAVDVTSTRGVVLAGAVNNVNGTTNITAGTAITSTSKTAVVTGQTINLSAQTGIGNGGVGTVPLAFTLTGASGAITATTAAGDINLAGMSGPVRVGNIAAGAGGNVTLSADGSIVQATPGAGAAITGHIIDLTSTSGSIGTAGQSLDVNVVPTGSGDLTAGLSAKAQTDINVRQPNGNFPLIHLESASGNITVEATTGSLVNANPVQKPDSRNQAQLLALWKDNQLLSDGEVAGGGAETSRDNALKSYQNTINQKYQTYWREARKLEAVQDNSAAGYHFEAKNGYDANYLVPLSAQEITQLKALKGWDDAQVAAYQKQLTQDFGAGAYNTAYTYAIPNTGSNIIVQNDLTVGYSWTQNQLKTGVTSTYFRQDSSSQTAIPDPNVKALNGNVTLKALTGSIGTDTTPVVIQGADLANPTDAQRLALAAAEAVDIQRDSSKITVLQRRAINVEAGTGSTIDAQARDHIYLGAQTDLRIKTAKANDSIRLKVQGGLYDVATGAAAVEGSANGLILEAAKESIGTAANPFRLNLTAGAPLTARAGKDIYLSQVAGSLSVASLYTPLTVHVTAAQNIFDVSDAASPVTIMGNGIYLTATGGSIGTFTAPVKVASGPQAGAEINATADKSGQDIYLSAPAVVGSTVFPHLNIGQLKAGDEISLDAKGDIVENSGSSVTALTFTTRSVGGQTLTAGANDFAAFNATNSGGGNIALTRTGATPLTISGATQTAGGDITVANSGALSITGGVSVSLTNTVDLSAGGTITETGSGWLSGGHIKTHSTGGQTLTGANTIVKLTATNSGGDIRLTNAAAPLNLAAITQTAGGDIAVTNTGAVSISGPVSTSGDVALTTSAAVTETGAGRIDANTLTTSSHGGQTLTGANTVATFNATNAGGDISFTNTAAPLTVSGLTQTGGDATVTNTGAIVVTGTLTNTAGTVNLSATSTITESGGGKADVAVLTTTSHGGQTLGSANTIGTFNAANIGGDTTLTNTAATLTLGSVSQDAGTVTIANTGDISVKRVAAAPGTVVLSASGGIYNGLGTTQSNIAAADIRLTTVGGDIGAAASYLNIDSGAAGGTVTADAGTKAIFIDAVENSLDLTVLSGDPVHARGKVNVGITRPVGDLVIDNVVSKGGSITLKAPTGNLTVNSLLAPLDVYASSLNNLSVATATIGKSGTFYADNISLPNVIHTGTTAPLKVTAAGDNKLKKAGNVSFSATTEAGVTFKELRANYATVSIDNLNLKFDNAGIGKKATFRNQYSLVVADRSPGGLLSVDVQLYPDPDPFWLVFHGPRNINTNAKVINAREGYNVNGNPADSSLIVDAGNATAGSGKPFDPNTVFSTFTPPTVPGGGSNVNTSGFTPPAGPGNLTITATPSENGQDIEIQ